MRYPFNGEYADQVQAITSWCNDAETLMGILSAGHADYHYQGDGKTNIDVDECLDKVYSHEHWRNILPLQSTVNEQLNRVAQEGHASSHFTNQNTLLATLSIALLSGAHTINEWCTKDNTLGKMFFNRDFKGLDSSSYALRMTIDTGAYIGTGIMPDGSERATTAVTILFARTPSYLNGEKLPFSITTMYPDITGVTGVGDLASTGRNYPRELANAINQSPIGARMYWLGQHCNIPCTLVHTTTPTAIFNHLHGDESMGIPCSFGYNDKSYNNGSLFVQSPNGKMVPVPRAGLARETVLSIRQEEVEKFGPLLQKAWDTKNPVIFPQSHLFLRTNEEQIYEDGIQIQSEEFDYDAR